MYFLHFLLALPALASAVEVRLRYDGGCNGGYLICSSIASRTCCGGIQNQRGYNSIGFLGMPRNSIVLASQTTHDGNNYGAEKARGNTGGGDNACSNFSGGGGQFAGGSYAQGGRKRRAAAEAIECTDTMFADALMLDDGTKFDLTKMDEDMIMEVNETLWNGTKVDNVPETLRAFEVAE